MAQTKPDSSQVVFKPAGVGAVPVTVDVRVVSQFSGQWLAR